MEVSGPQQTTTTTTTTTAAAWIYPKLIVDHSFTVVNGHMSPHAESFHICTSLNFYSSNLMSRW
jgi:hypothetical protein